jgi:hypothetical protein
MIVTSSRAKTVIVKKPISDSDYTSKNTLKSLFRCSKFDGYAFNWNFNSFIEFSNNGHFRGKPLIARRKSTSYSDSTQKNTLEMIVSKILFEANYDLQN